jgi:hypothetical protein
VGAVCAQAAALLHAARWGHAQHGAAHLPALAQSLQAHSPGAAQADKAALHIGAIAFIIRLGSSLNGHMHFHVRALNGVFKEVSVAVEGESDAQSLPPGIASTQPVLPVSPLWPRCRQIYAAVSCAISST